jgi:hypothetical protein
MRAAKRRALARTFWLHPWTALPPTGIDRELNVPRPNRASYGDRHLRERQARAELARVDRELKLLRAQLAALEQRRAGLVSGLVLAA